MKREKPLLIILVFITFAVPLTKIPSISYAYEIMTTPKIYIDPAAKVAQIGETFSVNISVSDVSDLASWQVFIYFKIDIVNATAYAEGPFLNSHGTTSFDANYDNNFNSTHGELWMYCLRTWSGAGVNGSGVLGIANFTAQTSTGSSNLSFYNPLTILGNSTADRINHTTEDGFVRIWPYDVTGDGYVGIDDIVAVAEHFGDEPGDPEWNPLYDINSDGYVGIDDIVLIAEHFGESQP